MAGFDPAVDPVYTDLYVPVAANTYQVDNFATVQLALDAVKATGGTLNFTAGQTYTLPASQSGSSHSGGKLRMTLASDFLLNGNGAIIDGINLSNANGSNAMFRFERCRNFAIKNLTLSGNRNGASGGVADDADFHNFFFEECNGVNIGGGRASLENVTSRLAGCDGFRLTSGDPSNANRRSQNFLFYKCSGLTNGRLGISLINAYNVQILGGSLSFNSGTDPNSGFDTEANDTSTPPTFSPRAVDQVLIRGVTFTGNNRSGIQFSQKGLPDRHTVEGCLFEGGSAGPASALSRGSGISMATGGNLIQKNTFRNLDTNYNPVAAIVYFHGQSACSNNVIFDNTFINNTQADPVILVHTLSGTGNQINGNRFSGNTGTAIVNNKPSGTTISGNDLNSSVLPTPTPPWDVTFEVAPGGGGAIEFDAQSTNGATFTDAVSWQHTPVGTPAGVVVLVVQRGSLGADEIATVTYGGVALTRAPSGFAQFTTVETGAAYAYHLGADIPTGAQSVVVSPILTAGGTFRAHAITVTADGDTSIAASGTVAANTANPTITLDTGTGVETFVCGALFSGINLAANLAPGADYTEIAEYNDASLRNLSFIRRTNDATGGSVTVDWVGAADEAAGVAIAIQATEVGSVDILVQPGGLSRTRAFGSPVVTITDPPLVLASIQGMARERALGVPTVETPVLEPPPVVEDPDVLPSAGGGGAAAARRGKKNTRKIPPVRLTNGQMKYFQTWEEHGRYMGSIVKKQGKSPDVEAQEEREREEEESAIVKILKKVYG